MKIRILEWKYLLFLMMSILVLLPACNKDKDAIGELDVSEIDVFIWNGLRQYYLWTDLVPELAIDNDTDLINFLNQYTDHEELFIDLLYQYGEIDRWSWIMDDYEELENLLQGITTSMGFEFGLVRINGTDDIFGFIEYVIPDTPADDAGLSRGEIFISIDGQNLTVNNYLDLLYNRDSYSISFADIIDNTITPNGKTVNLTAEVVEENPIHHSEIIDVNGTKVAYLVYNAFTSNYDDALNTQFEEYVNEGVQELILDLRYNGGGSVRTATYLASMIYGTNTELLLTENEYNDVLQNYLLSQDNASSYFENYFYDEIESSNNAINTLNLNRLYVLTSGSTASASELIINGLNPYLDVVVIGTNTHGKYVGSLTIKDYNTNGDINPNHKWAMQPIVFKTKNSEGVSDFVDGFAPDIEVEEDFANLLPFGDPDEPLLKAAIDHIQGNIPASFKNTGLDILKDSKDLKRFGKEMYIEKLK